MNNKKQEQNIKLFDDAYKNVGMGSYAIDCIIEKIKNSELKKLLKKQDEFYLNSKTKLDEFSILMSYIPKDINIMLKASSSLSINLKTLMNKETSHIAEMLIEGTTMGITTLIKEINQNKSAMKPLSKFQTK